MTPKNKTEAVKTARELAFKTLQETGSCAYSVTYALQETFGLRDDALLKSSSALTGGIGGMADTCGAMIAAILVLSSVCGRGRNETGTIKLFNTRDHAVSFYQWFKSKQGVVKCNDILVTFSGGKYTDFSDREQLIAAIEEGVLQKCDALVQDIAGEGAKRLWDEVHKKGKRINSKS